MKSAGLILLLAVCAFAQSVTSSLLGTAQDPSGSPVPNAEVQLVSQTTGEQLTVKTNTEGLFRFPVVEPDRYRLTIKANGFKAYALNQF